MEPWLSGQVMLPGSNLGCGGGGAKRLTRGLVRTLISRVSIKRLSGYESPDPIL